MSTSPPGGEVRRKAIQGATRTAVFWVVLFTALWALTREVSDALIGATCVVLVFGLWKLLNKPLDTLLHWSTRGGCAGPLLGCVIGAVLGVALFRGVGGGPAVAVGRELELAGPTLGGGEFDLRRLRGQVVLVDFWATWCGPCRAELPHVRELYRRYHEDGLEVVGISLDESADDLARFVAREGIPWPQVFFDRAGSTGFDNPLARACGVHAIPSTLLVDRQGRVSQVNLRGAALGREVARLLGKDPPPDSGDGSGMLGELARLVGAHLFQVFGGVLGCFVGLVMGGLVGRLARRLFARRA